MGGRGELEQAKGKTAVEADAEDWDNDGHLEPCSAPPTTDEKARYRPVPTLRMVERVPTRKRLFRFRFETSNGPLVATLVAAALTPRHSGAIAQRH